ncbi:MAG: winged helix-turn-helix domain-containing protein [Pyrinomonadaceae bacterium]|nr:winged helix-turn-helix domain-containing protein [Pyrinomonadaceae bacterium]
MSNETNSLYEFAEFRFDGKRGKLWRENELILLSPKETELLNLLLESNGEFVSKEEIFEKVWADTFVEDGVLTQNIYKIRKALGNDENGKPLIENKTKLGYRVTVPIVKTSEELEVRSEEKTTEPQATPYSRLLTPYSVTAIAVIPLILISVVAYRYLRPTPRPQIESIKYTQLTNTGNLTNATLSPDGNFLALVRGNKVFLKDLVSNREIPLEILNVGNFSSLQFSADGNFLYFRDNKTRYSSARILKTSRFGGETTVVAENSFASFSLSPDNKFLAYYENEKSDVNRLTIKNLETKEERQIFEPLYTGMFNVETAPVWSPDSKKILHINQWWGSLAGQLFVIEVETGKAEELKMPRLRRLAQAAWFPDGKSFVVSASEDGRYYHLWKVSYPDGDAQALTVGLSSYNQPVISEDGKKILALQSVVNSNLFVADEVNLNEQKQITNGNTNRFGQLSLAWADDQKIVFGSQTENESVENLWLIDSEGHSPKQLTKETKVSPNTPASDGKFIYYNVNRNRLPNINRILLNGENVNEITNESEGNRRSPQVTADGNWLYYSYFDAKGGKIMRRNLAETKEEVFLENENLQCGIFLALSNDGKYLSCFNSRPNQNFSEKYNAEIAIISVEDKSVKYISVDGDRFPLRFSSDSKAVEFTLSFEEGTQIMRQGLDEKEAKPILQMPKDHIFNFAWSPSNKKIVLSRGQQLRDAVLLTEFDK